MAGVARALRDGDNATDPSIDFLLDGDCDDGCRCCKCVSPAEIFLFSGESSDLRGERFFSNRDKKLFLCSVADVVEDVVDDVGDVEEAEVDSKSGSISRVTLILGGFISCKVDDANGSGSGTTATTFISGRVAVTGVEVFGPGECTKLDSR